MPAHFNPPDNWRKIPRFLENLYKKEEDLISHGATAPLTLGCSLPLSLHLQTIFQILISLAHTSYKVSLMNSIFLAVVTAITVFMPQIHAGGCISSGRKTSVVIPVNGAEAGFTIIFTPGKTTEGFEPSPRPLPSPTSFTAPSSARRALYKKTSSSTIASTSTEGNASASDADSLDSAESSGISFEEFKQQWINLRLFLTGLRSELFQFRMYYTSICKLSLKGKRTMLVYFGMCNSVYKRQHPSTNRAAFRSTTDIEEAYTDLKETFHRAIELAARHLHMGKMTRPACGYNLLFACPQSDMMPILGLKAPECPWCRAKARRAGTATEPHKHFDHHATTFNDVCPDCHQSFLKKLYKESPGQLERLDTLLAHCNEVAARLECIFPKMRQFFSDKS